MIKADFVSHGPTKKWKEAISFSQSNEPNLAQKLRCLEDYESIDLFFNDIILSRLRYASYLSFVFIFIFVRIGIFLMPVLLFLLEM